MDATRGEECEKEWFEHRGCIVRRLAGPSSIAQTLRDRGQRQMGMARNWLVTDRDRGSRSIRAMIDQSETMRGIDSDRVVTDRDRYPALQKPVIDRLEAIAQLAGGGRRPGVGK